MKSAKIIFQLGRNRNSMQSISLPHLVQVQVKLMYGEEPAEKPYQPRISSNSSADET